MSGKSRLHFIAGKGGVGRTTIAAALAQALAQAAPPSRPRVLVVEMDEATTRAVGEHPALAATLGHIVRQLDVLTQTAALLDERLALNEDAVAALCGRLDALAGGGGGGGGGGAQYAATG